MGQKTPLIVLDHGITINRVEQGVISLLNMIGSCEINAEAQREAICQP